MATDDGTQSVSSRAQQVIEAAAVRIRSDEERHSMGTEVVQIPLRHEQAEAELPGTGPAMQSRRFTSPGPYDVTVVILEVPQWVRARAFLE